MDAVERKSIHDMIKLQRNASTQVGKIFLQTRQSPARKPDQSSAPDRTAAPSHHKELNTANKNHMVHMTCYIRCVPDHLPATMLPCLPYTLFTSIPSRERKETNRKSPPREKHQYLVPHPRAVGRRPEVVLLQPVSPASVTFGSDRRGAVSCLVRDHGTACTASAAGAAGAAAAAVAGG